MKKLAKLVLFFSLTFLIILVTAACLRLLSLWVEWAKSLPPKPETTLTLFVAAGRWALSLSLFASILITLNYIIRRKHFPLTSIICVMLLCTVFCFAVSFALNQIKTSSGSIQAYASAHSDPAAHSTTLQLGEKGLILANSLSRNVTAVVMLDGTSNLQGPRVTATPGQPLIYQGGRGSTSALPSFPFGDDTPWLLKSLSIDLRMNAEMIQQMYTAGFFSYIIFVGSLIFLLCSLGFAIKFSVWPLANLFLVTLVFRGILALGTFFYTPAIQDIAASFLNNRLPVALALPVFFFGFGFMVYIYSLLAFAAKRKNDDDE